MQSKTCYQTCIDKFQINEINVDLRTSGFDNEVLSVTHALYDKRVSRSIV